MVTLGIFRSKLALMALMATTACGTPSVNDRADLAQSIAVKNQMATTSALSLDSQTLPVVSKVRIANKGQHARVYIEGDGLAYLSRSRKSPDPTPTNPVALYLAAADPYDNVIWLARPCQYTHDMPANDKCHPRYWTTARFAPETLSALNHELDRLKRLYDIPSFELIGFSGGGAMAGLLAAQRQDIPCFRSVAGNMDHTAFTAIHNTTPLNGSLNAADYGKWLSHIPQYHYVGDNDAIVPESIVQSYKRKINPQASFNIERAQGVSHEDGWVEHWPQLIQRTLACSKL